LKQKKKNKSREQQIPKVAPAACLLFSLRERSVLLLGGEIKNWPRYFPTQSYIDTACV
jgi:hypothetical protein